MLRLSGDDLAQRLADPRGTESLTEAVCVVVDGDVPGDVDLGGVPVVVVGSDVLVSTDAELGAVVDAVAAQPVAAASLAVLLRASTQRLIGEGLAAESATYSTLQSGPAHRDWLNAQGPRRAPDDAPAVRVERDGDVLRVTLARPHVHNAFNAAMRDGLVEALALAAIDGALRVEVAGDGPSFSSGGDLAEFGTAPDPATAHVVRLTRSPARALAAIADRVTVHVHGACAGAGVELPAFASRVLAREDARFWLPELLMGLVPGAGGTVSLPRRIGRQRTALMALTGTPVDAATALAWGLVDEVS